MLAPNALDNIEIADPHEALTIARYRTNGRLKILLVHDYESRFVTGINLNDYFKTDQENPIDLFNTYGRLRQRAKVGLMIWNPREIIRQILLLSNRDFLSDRGSIPLLPDTGIIAAGTIILSGTPAGVIFRSVNIWNGRLYLAEGDEVAMRSDRMGVLRNTIVD